ncbi:hypothetical protein [Mesobacillus foraminis]|uniref:hypothetical protein n=1 Tax=Mesobacillus foraminis TaxID=279826 RepID=UPI0013CF34FE|nr:hypothetical protein [Mesobacillus foraminis]
MNEHREKIEGSAADTTNFNEENHSLVCSDELFYKGLRAVAEDSEREDNEA